MNECMIRQQFNVPLSPLKWMWLKILMDVYFRTDGMKLNDWSNSLMLGFNDVLIFNMNQNNWKTFTQSKLPFTCHLIDSECNFKIFDSEMYRIWSME